MGRIESFDVMVAGLVPILYELRRIFTSKTVMILSLLIVLLTLLSAVGSASGGPTSADVNYYSFGYGYGSNGTYQVMVKVFSGSGQGYQGTTVNISLPNGEVLRNTTDSSGTAHFSFMDSNASQLLGSNVFEKPGYRAENWFSITYNYTIRSGSSSFTEQSYANVYLNQTDPYFFQMDNSAITGSPSSPQVTNISRYQLITLQDHSRPSRYFLQIEYFGNISTDSPKVDVYFHRMNGSLQNSFDILNLSEKNMTYFASYHGFTSLTVDPSNLSVSSNNSTYMFALFTPSGKYITALPFQIYIPYTSSQVSTSFFGTQMLIIGLFVPLMAAVSSYMTYGKDKTSGVLESVLIRPVSRKSVILSRYLANTLSVFGASLLAFAASSLVYYYYLGTFLPLSAFLYASWAILVSIASFVAMVFLATSYSRSQGSVLGFAIIIFFVFDLLWSFEALPVIPYLIITEIIRATPGSVGFARGYVTLFFYSPSGLIDLAGFLTSGNATILTGTTSVSLAKLGLTVTKFVVAGIFWIAIPLVLAAIAFTKRD